MKKKTISKTELLLKSKCNKYYQIKDNTEHLIFTNNIYVIKYKSLNEVYANEYRLNKYHDSKIEENVWFNYNNRLVFLSGIYFIKTKQMIVYSMDIYHKFLNKGDFDESIYNRICNFFNLEQSILEDFKKHTYMTSNEYSFQLKQKRIKAKNTI